MPYNDSLAGPAPKRVTPVHLRSARGWPAGLYATAPLLAAATSFVLGVALIHRHPVMYWADPYARLVNRGSLFVDRWLPLLQLVIYAVGKLTLRIVVLRIVLSAIGALTVVAGSLLAAELFNPAVAALFGVFLATNPMFVALSIVPYQEVLFLGLVLAGLSMHLRPDNRRNRILATLAFNLACLTRYEGWILVAVLAVSDLLGGIAGRGFRRALEATATLSARYGWPALAWILYLILLRRGRAPVG